jgi:tripartite-type tricarboxylate transporter receptor subunit TctC
MRSLIRGALIASALLALGSQPSAWAQDYPTRSISVIAPWAAGGAVDVVARIVAPKLSDRLG